MRPRTLFDKKCWCHYSVQTKLLDSNEWNGRRKVLAKNISKMDGDVKRLNDGAHWHIGSQKLISITVHVPLASWAQVALAHYSNPYCLSFTGKGKYGLLLAHPLLRHAVFVWVRTCVGGFYKETISTISKTKKTFHSLLRFSFSEWRNLHFFSS